MIVWVPAPSCEGAAAGTQTRLMSYLEDALPYFSGWPSSGPRAIAAQGRDPGELGSRWSLTFDLAAFDLYLTGTVML